MITLYIKTHNVTGLKYFGKTTKKDPYKYKGSGKYWLQHLKKHGYDVSTEIIGRFDSQEDCTKFALKFSEENQILESKEWANLRVENGLDGAPTGNSFSEETIIKMRNAKVGKRPREYFVEMAKKNVGRKQTDFQKQRARESNESAWIVISPSGQSSNIVNLSKFCRENNLDQGNMSRGKHKGWTCYKIT